MKRYPIENGTVIIINGVSIRVDDCTGEGSTCLVYDGRVLDNGPLIPETRVVIKEFYPQSGTGVFDITRDADGKLSVNMITKELTEYKERKKQFETGYKMQKHLANSEVMEVMVTALLFGDYGDTSYLVSDIHMGKSLDKVVFETLEDKLACAVRMAELFGILHEEGYMMLDFKPENFLWTERPKSVKLIDADSIFRYKKPQAGYGGKNGIASDVGDEDVFYINQKYGAPEILLLKKMLEVGAAELEEKKPFYLVPNVNVYNLARYLFELLFDRMPSEEDAKFPERLTEELYGRYESWFGNRKTAENLLGVLKMSLQDKCRERYPDGYHMMNGLNASIEEITSRKYMPKKAVAKANNTYLSYNLLEKYPLYEYSRRDDGTTILDIVIVGSHNFREALLKAVISCGQMLDSVLNIRLIAKDAEDFWEYYKSDACNPEVSRTVRWFVNGQPYDNGMEIKQAEIVDSPLANVYLETDDGEEHIAETIKENGTAYIVFACGREETDYGKAMNLIRKLPKRKRFVGYLTGERNRQPEQSGKTNVYPISMEKVSKGYNEKEYKSRIYQMGMGIHEYYYRGSHPRATKKEVRESYAKDIYNIESSERSALHANYKLKSIGIDPKSAKAPYLYYEKVLSSKSGEAKELFDKLAALEHRSWTAFMILSGVRGVDNVEERLGQYAYTGGNDWKERDEHGQVIVHPCLKAGRAGRGLEDPMIWEQSRNDRLNRNCLNALDPLDRRSLEIYDVICKIAERRKGEAGQRLAGMVDYLGKADETVLTAYYALLTAKDKVYEGDRGETNSAILWRQAVEEFTETCENEGVLTGNLKGKISAMEELMKPALWCTDYHDFKYSDEDILRALPGILIQNEKSEQKNSKITIVKPMAKEAWENIYSTMVVRPDLLVLVPFHGEGEEELRQYAAWLKSCRIETKVQITLLSQLREYGGKGGQIFIDETGIAPEHSRAICGNPYMRNAHLFRVEGRKLKPTDENTLITLFDRPVNLTVHETLMLHGATMVSEKTEDNILGLSRLQYISLWNLYRDLSDGRKWKIFVDELQRFEREKRREIRIGVKDKPDGYEAGYAEGSVMKYTRIGKVLEELSMRGLLLSYRFPAENDYGSVYFSTTYRELGEALKQAISKAVAEPLRHIYRAEVTEKTVILVDDSLYVSGKIPHEPDKELKNVDFRRDDVMGEVHGILERRGKDKVLQNFRFEKDSQRVSFRYASKSVKEVLMKEGSLLEAVVFHECRRQGMFDDIRANVQILWPGDRTKNEIDIIATKDSKTYFISVKMCMPETEHIYEIENLCRKFSVEGHAMLVSSYFATGKNEWKGTDYEMRPVALENRAEDIQRFFGDISYIGKDSVDAVKENVRNGKTERKRQIVIASSIADIIKEERG